MRWFCQVRFSPRKKAMAILPIHYWYNYNSREDGCSFYEVMGIREFNRTVRKSNGKFHLVHHWWKGSTEVRTTSRRQ